MAIYSRLTPARPLPKSLGIPSKASAVPCSSHTASSSLSNRRPTKNGDDHYFGPAIDRPPSPEMIRQVNKQMKESFRQPRLDHRTACSASSSSLSTTFSCESGGMDDEPSVLRPLTQGTDKAASRRRDDSAHLSFSRNLVGRKRLSKRDQSISRSPASSLYSTESTENVSSAKESLVPSLFSRRKPSRDDSLHRRFQVSNPFNFKHVLHTDRDAPPTNPSSSSSSSSFKPSNLLAMKATGPGSHRWQRNPQPSSHQHQHQHTDSSSYRNGKESGKYDRPPAPGPILVSPPTPASTKVGSSDQLMRRIRSQEELRTASSVSPAVPAGPSRSHTAPILPKLAKEASPLTASQSPAPPPRGSSRRAAHLTVNEQPAAGPSLPRPRTSGSIRHPAFGSTKSAFGPPLPPPISAFPSPPDSPKRHEVDFHGFTTSPMAVDLAEPSWPLAGMAVAAGPNERPQPLADVPEEEEQKEASKRSRMSMASVASVKGSHSIATLRRPSRSQRPMSGASETLGHFEFSAIRPATAAGGSDENRGFDCGVIEESWEDVIDYCYEHEAEADCDYQWERRSMDVARAAQMLEGFLAPGCQAQNPIGTAHSSPGMLSVPVLGGPASRMHTAAAAAAAAAAAQASSSAGDEAEAAASAFDNLSPGNFSLPRAGRLRVRASHASSFQESHGFTLSPSLLIPDEFHHQLLLEKGFRDALRDDDDEVEEEEEEGVAVVEEEFESSPLDGSTSSLSSKLAQWFHQRSSTSTTDSGSTSRTDFSREYHHSANSSWSFLTRPTTSSTSVSRTTIEATELNSSCYTPSKVPTYEAQQDDYSLLEQDTVPELGLCPRPQSSRVPHHKTHASESVVRSNEAKPFSCGFERTASGRRVRSRTTSMSTQLPPVGQYSLFPRSPIRLMGDQI